MTDRIENDKIDQALDGVDPAKRSFLRKVVVTTAFAAPVVASFAIDGMVVSKALATQVFSNLTNV